MTGLVIVNALLIHLYRNYTTINETKTHIEVNTHQTATPTTSTPISTDKEQIKYEPSSIETYFMENLVNLGYDKAFHNTSGCNIWNNETSEIYLDLHEYADSLNAYNEAVKNFTEIPDLMESIKLSGGDHQICNNAKFHPDGFEAFFKNMKFLSRGNSGFMEPLTTPMRHHGYCIGWRPQKYLFEQNYIVHDYEAMCKQLKPTSRRVFIDIGASMKRENNPLTSFLAEFKKFGFHFDHIYAFEITPFQAKEVYEDILPDEYMASYHWINTGVKAGAEDKLNPLHSILRKFNEDDFVVVKLDIDHSETELPLAFQLLEDESLHPLVDQFYFEHHVFLAEMARWWTESMSGSIKDSMELFHGLRQKGVPSHFWI